MKAIAALAVCACASFAQTKDYPVKPVPFTAVHVNDTFWAPRIETNRTVTIPFAFKKDEETGRVDNFIRAAEALRGDTLRESQVSALSVRRHRRLQSDRRRRLYAERASRSPSSKPTATTLIKNIAAAQEPDGYLYTARTIDPAASASLVGTGALGTRRREQPRTLRSGPSCTKPPSPIIRPPANARCWTSPCARPICSIRLSDPASAKSGPAIRSSRWAWRSSIASPATSAISIWRSSCSIRAARRATSRAPATPTYEAQQARGGSDRGACRRPRGSRHVYVLRHGGRRRRSPAIPAYVNALDRIWDNVAGKKLHITGGVGARAAGEAFGADYELPNMSAYNETCAAVGNDFWNHRLFLLHADAKYIDVMERTLYNGLISGVSLDGKTFFYQNPLEATGKAGKDQRSPWFGVACCPGNITRFMAVGARLRLCAARRHALGQPLRGQHRRNQDGQRPHREDGAGDALSLGRRREDDRDARSGRRPHHQRPHPRLGTQ